MTRTLLSKEHRPTLALFSTYDAGLHTLPEELVRRRAAVTRIEAKLDEIGEPPSRDAEGKLGRSWAEIACDEDFSLDLTTIDEADAARTRHERQTRLLGIALSEAGAALSDAVHAYAEEAIRDHLAPAIEHVMADVRTAVTAYAKHGKTPAAMLKAPTAARNAFMSVDNLAAQFSQIRELRRRLLDFTGRPQADVLGDFSMIRNAEKMWPAMLDLTRQQFGRQSPWHTVKNTRELFEWLTENPDAEVWCPTAAEQDARWHAVFGPRVAEHRAGRQAGETLLAVMGGRG
jgi:hypothetical protein